MSAKHQWFVVGAVVAMLAIVLVMLTRATESQFAPITVGMRAPTFAARTLDERTTKTLADYRGQVVLLNVWATYCVPCLKEMPSIEQLHKEFGPKGLHVVAVSVDDPGSEGAIQDFVTEHQLTFEVLFDPTSEIMRRYQIAGIPQSFLIGKDGVIRQRNYPVNWYSDANRAVVAQLLGAAAPAPLDTAHAGSAR